MKIQIFPSLLAADFGRLAEGARLAEDCGADALHLDIMDGHFVPNISFGPEVVKMSKRETTIPLHVHLMLSRPDKYLETFIEAGADTLLIHVESECDVAEALRKIRELGVAPGITINPDTPADSVFPLIELVDEILIMSVYPGYGGQKFIKDVLVKATSIRRQQKASGREELVLSIDGGIGRDNIEACAAHGVDSFVAGTSLYKCDDMSAELSFFRQKASESFTLPG